MGNPLQNFTDKVGPAVSAAFLNQLDQTVNQGLNSLTTKQAIAAWLGVASPVNFPIGIAEGGTGAATAAAALAALGALGVYAVTALETAASVVPTNTSYPPGNVLRYGLVGDGATDNTSNLTSASSIGYSLFFPLGVYKVNSNCTVTVPCNFDYGSILKPAATLTINGPVNAGPWQIFDESLGGVISGLIRPVNADGRMYFEWWGAKGDGVTDDTVKCQAALRAAATANYVGIQMLPKQYLISAQLNVNGNTTQSFKAVSIHGTDSHISQFLTTTANINMLSYIGGSGTSCGAVLENIGFQGLSASTVGIVINGQCGLRFKRCYFNTLQYGIQFYNLATGSFTEHNVAEDCEFTYSCLTPLYYQVGSGTNSFHGSGVQDCVLTSNTTNPLVLIGSGARPYQCPLDGQIFFANNNTLVQNNSSIAVDFLGKLRIENLGGGTLTLGAGGNVPFVGTISCSQQNVVGGTMTQMQGVITNNDTIQTYLGARKAYTASMTTGANSLTSSVFNQHRLVYVRFIAANYDYRYLLGVDPNGGGSTGVVATIINYLGFNAAGYGAPTFTVNTSGVLIATNGSWPASGVTAYWGDSTLGFGNETLEIAEF